jgi:hypothetical protein
MFGACTQLDARQNPALSTADMPNPRDTGNNIQTCESGATGQPAKSVFSSDHSTIGSVGTDTGNLCQRATDMQILKTARQANCSSCGPRYIEKSFQSGIPIPPSVASISERHPSDSPVDLLALFHAHLDTTGEKLEEINFIVDFIEWISQSDFLRFQQLEPRVGDPSNYPVAVKEHGIKGQSVYTALVHLERKELVCKLCPYNVMDELEDAITHVRVHHFRHYPYHCSPTQTQWYVSFSPSLWVSIQHTFPSGLRFATEAELDGHQATSGH